MPISPFNLRRIDGEFAEWMEVANMFVKPHGGADVKDIRRDIIKTYCRFVAYMITASSELSDTKVELWKHILADKDATLQNVTESLEQSLTESFQTSVPLHIQAAAYYDVSNADHLASLALVKIKNIGIIVTHIVGGGKPEQEFQARYVKVLVEYISHWGVLFEVPDRETFRNSLDLGERF